MTAPLHDPLDHLLAIPGIYVAWASDMADAAVWVGDKSILVLNSHATRHDLAVAVEHFVSRGYLNNCEPRRPR